MNPVKKYALVLIVLPLIACQPDQATSQAEPETVSQAESTANIVRVIAKDFKFDVADELLSGWTTFQLRNEGHATHFFLLNRIPEGVSFEQYRDEGAKVFDVVWDAIRAGQASKEEAGAMLGELLPEWFFSVRQMGGAGLIAPGETAQTTLLLESGRYVMECYIKNEQGVFHTTMGMMKPLTVLEASSPMTAPQADVVLRLTNFNYAISGRPVAGKNIIGVRFEEHPEFGLGNDVHLAKLENGTDLQEVIEWMDWMNIGGLQSPAPARFLGGTQEMPVGSTAYFTVQLEPGSYAWLAESAAEKGMVESFVIEGVE